MNKQEFFEELRARLSGLPEGELEERFAFWSEMIDDRVEEGLTEEAAVEAIGGVDEIAEHILSEVPLLKLVKEKVKPNRKMAVWKSVLLWVGSPIWLSLLISALAVIFSLYVSAWAIVVSFWASFGGIALGAIAALIEGVALILHGFAPVGLVMFAAAMVLAGLAILFYFGTLVLTKLLGRLSKKMPLAVKRCFVRKGERYA